MATYSTVKGFNIQSHASDPSNPSDGEVWYNTTSKSLKGYGALGPSSWASTTAMNTGRSASVSAAPTSTAILIASGTGPPAEPGNTLKVEEWNGTTWTEKTDMTTLHSGGAGGGTVTAMIVAGGTGYTPTTETWNGSAWTEQGDMLVGKSTAAGSGSTGSLKLSGGLEKIPAPAPNYGTNTTEDFDGSSWTNGTSMTRIAGYGQAGTPFSPSATALVMGQLNFPPMGSQSDVVELWNGSAWTEMNNFTTPRHYGMGAGISTAALLCGGNPDRSDAQTFDGTNWTTIASLAAAAWSMVGGGSSTSCIAGGGDPGAPTGMQILGKTQATKTFSSS
jgi:hypothetical protein